MAETRFHSQRPKMMATIAAEGITIVGTRSDKMLASLAASMAAESLVESDHKQL
jgi:hypothetical protein